MVLYLRCFSIKYVFLSIHVSLYNMEVYNIQFVQTPIKKTSQALVIEKLESLGEKYEWIIRADVFFKEEYSERKIHFIITF